MRNKEFPFFTNLFILAAIWNLIGAGFGYFHPSFTFYKLFNRELNDALFHDIYQGAWGTTLTYFIGYLIVAYNPVRHTGIVIIGGIGKVAFAWKLMQFYFSGIAEPVIFVIIIGDFIFSLFFIYYFIKMYSLKKKII